MALQPVALDLNICSSGEKQIPYANTYIWNLKKKKKKKGHEEPSGRTGIKTQTY